MEHTVNRTIRNFKKRQLPRGSKGGGGPVLRQLWAKLMYYNRAIFSYYMYIVKYWQAESPVAIVIALQMYCNTNIYKVSSDQSNRKIRPYLHTCMHRFKVTSLLIGVLLITTYEKCFIWLIVKVLFNFEHQHVYTHTLTHPQELNTSKQMTYPSHNNLRNGIKMTLFYLDILDLIRCILRETWLYSGHGDIPLLNVYYCNIYLFFFLRLLQKIGNHPRPYFSLTLIISYLRY